MKRFSEKELITGLIEGDLNSYESLFERYYGRVVAYARQLSQNHWVADEIAQNVFVKLWLNRSKLREDSIMGAYMFLLTKNEVIDHFRASRRLTKYRHDAELKEAEEMVFEHDLELIEKTVAQAVAKMPPQRRQIYRLSREENMSNDDIATFLGISKRTTEKHISLALRQIRLVMSRIDSFLVFFF